MRLRKVDFDCDISKRCSRCIYHDWISSWAGVGEWHHLIFCVRRNCVINYVEDIYTNEEERKLVENPVYEVENYSIKRLEDFCNQRFSLSHKYYNFKFLGDGRVLGFSYRHKDKEVKEGSYLVNFLNSFYFRLFCEGLYTLLKLFRVKRGISLLFMNDGDNISVYFYFLTYRRVKLAVYLSFRNISYDMEVINRFFYLVLLREFLVFMEKGMDEFGIFYRGSRVRNLVEFIKGLDMDVSFLLENKKNFIKLLKELDVFCKFLYD